MFEVIDYKNQETLFGAVLRKGQSPIFTKRFVFLFCYVKKNHFCLITLVFVLVKHKNKHV